MKHIYCNSIIKTKHYIVLYILQFHVHSTSQVSRHFYICFSFIFIIINWINNIYNGPQKTYVIFVILFVVWTLLLMLLINLIIKFFHKTVDERQRQWHKKKNYIRNFIGNLCIYYNSFDIFDYDVKTRIFGE